jgi:hypothetical protein
MVPLSIIGAVRTGVVFIRVIYYILQDPSKAIFVVPLTFAFAYQYDMYYHNKMQRVRMEADRLILEEPHLFELPEHSGLYPTSEEYHKAVRNN